MKTKRAAWTKDRCLLAVVAMAFAYFLVFSALSILQHRAFYTANDLGVFNQKLYNTLHGRFFVSPEMNGAHYAHMDYLILAYAPIYVFFPYAETLLVMQSMLLAAAAVPLYLLAKRRLKDGRAALAVAAAYLLYPALHYLNLYDYHSTIMAVPLLITGFWLFDSGRFSTSIPVFSLAMLSDETVSIFVALTGLYFLAFTKNKKWPLRLAMFAAAWFIIEMMIVLPSDFVSGGSYFDIYAGRYDHLGSTQAEAMSSIIADPVAAITYGGIESRMTYALQMLAPLGFIPLADAAILISAPQVAANFFSKYDWMRSITQSYTPLIIPFAFISAVIGIQRLGRRWPKIKTLHVSAFMLACCMVSLFVFGVANPRIATSFSSRMVQDPVLTGAVEATLAGLPATSTVSAPHHILPHMQGYDRIYRQPQSIADILNEAMALGPISHVIIDYSPAHNRLDVNETEATEMMAAAGYRASNVSTVFLYALQRNETI